jgi:hypothetical protein
MWGEIGGRTFAPDRHPSWDKAIEPKYEACDFGIVPGYNEHIFFSLEIHISGSLFSENHDSCR